MIFYALETKDLMHVFFNYSFLILNIFINKHSIQAHSLRTKKLFVDHNAGRIRLWGRMLVCGCCRVVGLSCFQCGFRWDAFRTYPEPHHPGEIVCIFFTLSWFMSTTRDSDQALPSLRSFNISVSSSAPSFSWSVQAKDLNAC